MSWTTKRAAKTTLTLQLKTPYLTDLQNEGGVVLRASHARCEIRSMALAVLPEDQSRIPGSPQITLNPAAVEAEVEVEVVLGAVAVEVAVEVALEVEAEEVPNDSANRDG